MPSGQRRSEVKELEDLDPMPFGMHKGVRMQDVPARYLHYLWTTGLRNELKTNVVARYIQRNLSALAGEYTDGIWSGD